MIRWLTTQLPKTRRALQAERDAVLAAQQQRQIAAETAHCAWLDGLPATLRLRLEALPRHAQEHAHRETALTPPHDHIHALERHFRWTESPPSSDHRDPLALRIRRLMDASPRADGSPYTVAEIAAAVDDDFDPIAMEAFLAGARHDVPIEAMLNLQRFYQVSPMYLIPVIHVRIVGVMTLETRRWIEQQIRFLMGPTYREKPPLAD